MSRYKALEKYLRNLGYDPAAAGAAGAGPVALAGRRLIDQTLDMSPAARQQRASDLGFGDKVWYHGSTHDIDAFQDPTQPGTRYLPGSYQGPGIYLTDSVTDVSHNYAGFGPDLTGRIDQVEEEIIGNLGYDYDVTQEIASDLEKRGLLSIPDDIGTEDLHELITSRVSDDDLMEATNRLARSRLVGESEGVVYPIRTRTEGVLSEDEPFFVMEDGVMDYDEAVNRARDDLGPDADPDDIEDLAAEIYHESLDEAVTTFFDRSPWFQENYGGSRVMDDVVGTLTETGELTHRDVFNAIERNNAWIEGDEGIIPAGAIASKVAQDFGVKGLIMDAGERWGDSMVGTEGAKHLIMFDPTGVRSVNAAFDPTKKTSSDMLGYADPGLLAGIAGATGAGALAAGAPASGQEAQAGALAETADDPGLTQVIGPYLLDRAGGAVNAAMTPLRGLRGLYELALTGDINAAASATQPGFENNMNSLEVLDLPLRGLLGLAAGGDINQMADIARQDSDQTLFDFGGWVTDLASQNQTLRPFASALGTAAYTVPTFLSPI